MRFVILFPIVFVNVFLAACTATGSVEPANSDLFGASTAPATRAVLAELPPSSTDTPIPDPTILTRTPWPPDSMPSPTPVPPFPGMVYTTDEGLWRVNAEWQPELLFNQPGVLEPNGRRLLVERDGDIWLVDLDTGTQQNLTNTPDTGECCPQWWPGRPDTFLVMRQIPDSAYEIGQITAVTLDGGYTILVEDLGASLPAISPDGQTIAFEVNGQPALYRQESEIELLLLPTGETNRFLGAGSPSWSPDGQKLAWQARFTDETGQTSQALVIYEATSASGYLLHPYQPAGIDSWGPAPMWSPNGTFIAFFVMDQNRSQHGLWVASTAGKVEKYIGSDDNSMWSSADPVWSPDNQYLLYQIAQAAFLTYAPDFTGGINVFLPPGAMVIDWQEP